MQKVAKNNVQFIFISFDDPLTNTFAAIDIVAMISDTENVATRMGYGILNSFHVPNLTYKMRNTVARINSFGQA